MSLIVSDDATTCMVYDVLSRLHERNAAFAHRIDDSRKMTIEQVVQEGLADVGIVYDDGAQTPGLTFEHVFDEPFSVWMRQDNPLAGRPAAFSELSSCAVLFSANRKFQTWVDGMRAACGRYGCSPAFRMKNVDSITDYLISLQTDEVVFASTSIDHMVPRVNARLRKMDLAHGGLLLYPVYLVYRTEHDNPLVDEFIALFREAAASDAPRREV